MEVYVPFDEWGLDPRWKEKLNRYVAISQEYAAAKAKLTNLENVKRTVLAQAMKTSGESSIGAQTREADTSEAYMGWCREVHEATFEYEKLRLTMKALELWFDMARTEAATKRTMMSQGA